MNNMYNKCRTECVSDYITCIKCDSSLHFNCMHAAGIIKTPWSIVISLQLMHYL